MLRFSPLLLLLIFLFAGPVFAGTTYEVTSKLDGKKITYKVRFGGGKLFEQYTAYDPASKKFVYFSWKRSETAPKPVCSIWDHQTGRQIDLYSFPNVKHPLPVIPSMQAMKACPKTGDRSFAPKRLIIYD